MLQAPPDGILGTSVALIIAKSTVCRTCICFTRLYAAFSAVPLHFVQAPPDGILGITEAFKADGDSRKLNLGVGAYRTEEGQPLVLSAVRQAEQRLVADGSRNKEYQPM